MDNFLSPPPTFYLSIICPYIALSRGIVCVSVLSLYILIFTDNPSSFPSALMQGLDLKCWHTHCLYRFVLCNSCFVYKIPSDAPISSLHPPLVTLNSGSRTGAVKLLPSQHPFVPLRCWIHPIACSQCFYSFLLIICHWPVFFCYFMIFENNPQMLFHYKGME